MTKNSINLLPNRTAADQRLELDWFRLSSWILIGLCLAQLGYYWLNRQNLAQSLESQKRISQEIELHQKEQANLKELEANYANLIDRENLLKLSTDSRLDLTPLLTAIQSSIKTPTLLDQIELKTNDKLSLAGAADSLNTVSSLVTSLKSRSEFSQVAITSTKTENGQTSFNLELTITKLTVASPSASPSPKAE